MAGVLSKIVKTDAETKEHLESIDTTLQSLYELQLGTEKREAKESKRKKQSDKRRRGDSFLDKLNLSEKEKKEQRKGLFESLKNIFKNLGSGLLGGFGGLVGKLFKIGGPISSIITGAFSTLFKAGGSVMTGLAKGLGMLLGSPWFWKAAAIAGMSVGAVKGSKNLQQSISQAKSRTGKTKSGVVFEQLDVTNLRKKFLDDQLAAGITGGEEHNKKKQQYLDLISAMNDGKGQKDDIEKKQKERDESIAERERIKSSWNAKIAEEEDERKKNNMITSRDVALGVVNPRIQRLNEELRTLHFNHRQNTRIISNLADGLMTDQEIVQQQLSDGRRSSIPDHLEGKVTPATLMQQMSSGFGSAEDYENNLNALNAKGYQTGGPIKVPGSGSGDKVPMMLPQGSFVMNRNAASMGYQTGGIPKFQSGGMIPTLLEPGEHVYGPGQWDSSHMMMNNSIPRFQTGGVVRASHEHTGSGWGISGVTDKKGRPAVFSKGGAEAWAKMIAESGGAVKGSDINSSKRSPSHNITVKGVSNSRHLTGDAVDVQTGSSTWNWLKQHGSKHGWKFNNYMGPQGWHFDYNGAGKNEGEDAANVAAQNAEEQGGASGLQSFISSIGSMGGKFGEFVSGALGSLGDVFGDDSGGLMNAIFGGLGGALGGGGGGDDNSNNLSTESAPLTGDTLSMAKKIYEYVKQKGYSDAQAKGIVANVHRESTFDVDAVGDNGDSHGLFQWNTSRADKMKAALPNYASNWKGQVDYALGEHVGPQYKGATAGMSAKDAAYWWMNKWEIPQDRVRGGNNHKKMNGFIDSYSFQKGGVVNRAQQPSISKASQQMATRRHLARSSGKNIQVIPVASKGSPSSNSNPGAQNQPPDLSAYPANVIAMDLSYRTSIGGVV